MENKEIESIIFEVEKELTKPNSFIEGREIKSILSSIFERGNDYKKHEGETYCFLDEYIDRRFGRENNIKRENLPMEILNCNFDTDKSKFWNYNKKSLIRGLMLAYQYHYPITVSPDMILILFLQGYSRFMESNSEKFRHIYVNYEGKKKITIKREGVTPESATKEVWEDIISEFTGEIKKEVGENIISNLESNFTTTNAVTLATSQLSIMSAMKQYFTYKVIMCVCGISAIKLEGSLEDWQKIKNKFEFLSKEEYGLDWWTKHLIPIIDKIIETKKYYSENKCLNNTLRLFWKDIIRVKRGGCYRPDVIDGWIVKFIPILSEGMPKVNDYLEDHDIPDQIISCPLKLIFMDKDNKQIEYDCSLASGFYGMIQDEKYFVKPVIGYAIVVEEKNIV